MYDKTATTFSIRQYNEHGYRFTEICIRQCYVNSVQEQLDGCVDNKAGYQSLEIAQFAAAKFGKILAAGYESTYSPVTYGLEITIRFQHYVNRDGEADGYCDPHFDTVGKGFSGMEKGMKFLRKLGSTVEKLRAEPGDDPRKVSSHTFESPERLVTALRKLKIVETTFDRDLDETVRVQPSPAASEAA